jgi:hypothetical protein
MFSARKAPLLLFCCFIACGGSRGNQPASGVQAPAHIAVVNSPPNLEIAILAPPQHVACQFDGEWSGPLRVLPEDPEPFAQLNRADEARITLPQGSASQGAFGSFALRGVTMSGTVMSPELPLALKRSTLLNGFIWTTDAPALRWTSASQGRVRFEVALDARVRVRSTPRGEATCAELGLETRSDVDYSLLRTWLGKRAVNRVEWRPAAAVPLSLEPGAAPVAEIDTRPEEPEAEPASAYLIRSHGDFLQIIAPSGGVLLVGWVPAYALQSPVEAVEPAELMTDGDDPNEPIEPLGSDDPTHALGAREQPSFCAWNAPLAVEAGGRVWRIGRIASAIPLDLGERRGALREVSFEHPALSYDREHVRFLVPEPSLYACGFPDSAGYGIVQTRP